MAVGQTADNGRPLVSAQLALTRLRVPALINFAALAAAQKVEIPLVPARNGCGSRTQENDIPRGIPGPGCASVVARDEGQALAQTNLRLSDLLSHLHSFFVPPKSGIVTYTS